MCGWRKGNCLFLTQDRIGFSSGINSLQKSTKTTKAVTLLRKWIAKSMSIIDHYLGKNVKGRLISFDSNDMCISDSYDPSHESNFYQIYQ